MRRLVYMDSHTAVEAATAALARFYEMDRDDLARPDAAREVARLLVQLRTFYTTADGVTDWAGRTNAYRQQVAAIYSAAGVSPDDKQRVGNAIRWYVRSELREQAPADELATLGLDVAPRETDRKRRAERSAILAAVQNGGGLADDVEMAPLRAVNLAVNSVAHVSDEDAAAVAGSAQGGQFRARLTALQSEVARLKRAARRP